jgi:hypothetical protein
VVWERNDDYDYEFETNTAVKSIETTCEAVALMQASCAFVNCTVTFSKREPLISMFDRVRCTMHTDVSLIYLAQTAFERVPKCVTECKKEQRHDKTLSERTTTNVVASRLGRNGKLCSD